MKISAIFVLFTFLFVCAIPHAGAAPLWSDDLRIWDMTGTSTWSVPGFTYCAGIIQNDSTQYAAAITDSTATQRNTIKLFRSLDDGNTWIRRTYITSEDWTLTDPELLMDTGNPPTYLYLMLAGTTTSDSRPLGVRYTLPSISLSGYIEPDWSIPDTLISVEMVYQPESDELWLFGGYTNNNIYLSRSSDYGDSWTPAELVASGAALPSAAAGPDDWVYLTYRRVSDDRIMSISYGDSSYYQVEVGQGGPMSAPIIASETTGDSDRSAIVYHDGNDDVRIAVSGDYGASWGSAVILTDDGIYPFVDVRSGSRECALSYIDQATGRIMTMAAPDLDALQSATPLAVSDQPVFQSSPPVVRRGYQPEEVALFYMNPGSGPQPEDLWYDNSLRLESNPQHSEEIPGLNIYPNPFAGSFTVSFANTSVSASRLSVYSLDGRLVETLYSGDTSGESIQAGSDLPAGVYTVVLVTDKGTSSRRVIRL